MRGLFFVCLGLAAPAAAQSPLAEVSLRHQLRTAPDDQMTIANLASLYVRSGRTAKAHRLYRGLLGLENVMLERANGDPMWSHQIAEIGIRTNPLRAAPALTAR